ncbi:MAG: alanine racemase [Porticoccaceae bacterium]|jgi:alanine racemase|nr:alanine racemase [Porticoccaceae bacterium]
MTRPSYIEVDLKAIRSNLDVAKKAAPNSKVVACVKANAYGHGAAEVAKALDGKVDLFGLACLEEAMELRQSGVETPPLLLEGCFTEEEWQWSSELGFSSVIHNKYQLEFFLSLKLPKPTSIWLKLDSGMHRLGFAPEDYQAAYDRLAQDEHSNSITLMSHFSCSEELKNPFNDQQLNTFVSSTEAIDAKRSLANSAAILTREDTHFDWIRPGYMLYGNSPMPGETPKDRGLSQAMGLYSEVLAIRTIAAGEAVGYNQAWRANKETTIAVVAVGYGDGYPRNVKNGTPVLVEGKEASTVGHVAMDMMLIDISHLPKTRIGAKVEIWGPNLSVSRVAEHSGMSGYELLTRLTTRLPRRYIT